MKNRCPVRGWLALALAEFCRPYGAPLYACERRQGYSPKDAQDLTKEFFSRLLEDHSQCL